jgi:hypothetical protein
MESGEREQQPEAKSADEKLAEWGKPLGLPSPANPSTLRLVSKIIFLLLQLFY